MIGFFSLSTILVNSYIAPSVKNFLENKETIFDSCLIVAFCLFSQLVLLVLSCFYFFLNCFCLLF